MLVSSQYKQREGLEGKAESKDEKGGSVGEDGTQWNYLRIQDNLL